jgi:hypothetical protein
VDSRTQSAPEGHRKSGCLPPTPRHTDAPQPAQPRGRCSTRPRSPGTLTSPWPLDHPGTIDRLTAPTASTRQPRSARPLPRPFGTRTTQRQSGVGRNMDYAQTPHRTARATAFRRSGHPIHAGKCTLAKGQTPVGRAAHDHRSDGSSISSPARNRPSRCGRRPGLSRLPLPSTRLRGGGLTRIDVTGQVGCPGWAATRPRLGDAATSSIPEWRQNLTGADRPETAAALSGSAQVSVLVVSR